MEKKSSGLILVEDNFTSQWSVDYLKVQIVTCCVLLVLFYILEVTHCFLEWVKLLEGQHSFHTWRCAYTRMCCSAQRMGSWLFMPGLLTEDTLLHLLWALGALTLTRDKCRLELAQLPMVRVSLGSLSLMLPPGVMIQSYTCRYISFVPSFNRRREICGR